MSEGRPLSSLKRPSKGPAAGETSEREATSSRAESLFSLRAAHTQPASPARGGNCAQSTHTTHTTPLPPQRSTDSTSSRPQSKIRLARLAFTPKAAPAIRREDKGAARRGSPTAATASAQARERRPKRDDDHFDDEDFCVALACHHGCYHCCHHSGRNHAYNRRGSHTCSSRTERAAAASERTLFNAASDIYHCYAVYCSRVREHASRSAYSAEA